MNISLSSREFSMLQKYIEDESGIVIRPEKAYFIENRLRKILENEGLLSYEELLHKAQREKPDFSQKVIDAITINETYWFRDKSPWYIMEEIFLPGYIKEMQDGSRTDVHIWSCACSSGQEPYSIAMCIDNYLSKNKISDISFEQFHITATDLSRTMLAKAVEGKYDKVSMERGLDLSNRNRYFHRKGNRWVVCDKIKNSVFFFQFNLKNDCCSFRNYDIIFCRNVFIYFSESLKREILEKLLYALKPNGLLFVGASEIISGFSRDIEVGTHKNGVFFRLKE